MPVPDGFPYQDYRQLIDTAAAKQIGVIAIRVLAGGALSGSVARHVNAARTVDPVAVGQSLPRMSSKHSGLLFWFRKAMLTI